MNTKEILKQLKSLSNESAKKTMLNHGASAEKYLGVRFSDLEKLRKKIKIHHVIAQELWDSKIEDAQILAAMVDDPEKITIKEARRRISEVSFFMISNYLGGLYSQTPFAIEFMEEEMNATNELLLHNGYDILSSILKRFPEKLSLSQCKKYLKRIEKEIHTAPNRGRSAMNMALISLGVYKPDIRQEVIAAAKRIGKVHVDHGKTNCKTPDAVSYIAKCVERLEKKKK